MTRTNRDHLEIPLFLEIRLAIKLKQATAIHQDLLEEIGERIKNNKSVLYNDRGKECPRKYRWESQRKILVYSQRLE